MCSQIKNLASMDYRMKEHQYNETNVMHFLFNLLRLKGLSMFRALLAHPQEAPQKEHLVYCVRVMLFGCIRIDIILPAALWPWG
jgi:hypothetical protein